MYRFATAGQFRRVTKEVGYNVKVGQGVPHPTFLPILPGAATYQMKRNPIRPVRGPRIAVGRWKFTPVVAEIVSAA